MNPQLPFVAWQLPVIGENQVSNLSVLQRSTAGSLHSAREAAIKEGYEIGVKKGMQEVSSLQLELKTLIDKLQQPLRHQDLQLEEAILAIVVRLTQSCLRAELTLNPENILTMIQQCLGEMKKSPQKSVLNVHPDDVNLLRSHFQTLELENIEISANPELSRGEFEFLSSQLRVDARIETYLGEISQKILAHTHE